MTDTAAVIGRNRAPRTGKPPHWLTALEIPRAGLELLSLSLHLPLLAAAPRGDGHAVLVLPGFATNDRWTVLLRSYLRGIGYDAHAWRLGRNLGPHVAGPDLARLNRMIADLAERSGGGVSLVGWSLGGIMARIAARRQPDLVRRVLTVGSPFSGDPRAAAVWPMYSRFSGQSLSQARRLSRSQEAPLPVPSTAIYSRSDGIAAWQNCRGVPDPLGDEVEVISSHMGLPFNPWVWLAVARILARPVDSRPHAGS